MTSMGANSWIGLLSDSAESVRQMLLEEGSYSIDLMARKVTRLGALPSPFLEITMPCGKYRLYKLEEIPKKSDHCTCGDSLHWFIKYGRIGQPPRFNISPN